jgi:hypothetical protein
VEGIPWEKQREKMVFSTGEIDEYIGNEIQIKIL